MRIVLADKRRAAVHTADVTKGYFDAATVHEYMQWKGVMYKQVEKNENQATYEAVYPYVVELGGVV